MSYISSKKYHRFTKHRKSVNMDSNIYEPVVIYRREGGGEKDLVRDCMVFRGHGVGDQWSPAEHKGKTIEIDIQRVRKYKNITVPSEGSSKYNRDTTKE